MERPDPMSFGQEKIPDEAAYECAECASRLFMFYGITICSAGFDEPDCAIQDYVKTAADPLRLSPNPSLQFDQITGYHRETIFVQKSYCKDFL
jgi:hypothetical protein